ncbi:MAG TPA: arylamine N-acetyltransferase [Pyrinomonadaceae bacterium]|jgi:N-hydroxyarylamine O-acetyltransferase|nr:arylamine N-acetyltransferase [Pyrinomonadaceae bacterium]
MNKIENLKIRDRVNRYLNITAYLERINYRGSLATTAETLRALQVAHLSTVPFENLSIHAREPIVLEDEALFTKIVKHRRGGFCYEANGLFAALLRALGFDVVMLSAEVANEAGEFGPGFDHLMLMVSLEQRRLVDVGFGDSFVEPLLLDERREQVQGSRSYRILSDGTQLTLRQRDEGNEWQAQYRFTLQTYCYADYAERCNYHQTSPQSHFTRSRICSRATEQGRLTLSGMRLITTSPSGARQIREERTLSSEAEYADVLREEFGIVMGN